MGQINTNNYPTVNSLADADLLIVENATNGTGTTTPKQLRENAIGTGTLQTSAQTVTGAINELKHDIDLGAGVARYDVNTITSGYLGQFSGSANLLLLHLTTDGTADATNGYMMMLSYSRPVARFAYGRLVDADGVAYKQDVYADNTIICTISGSGEGTESDPVQVVILGIINAGFMLTPTAVVSDRDIIDGQGNTLSVLAEALTKTASGNPVVITDCAGGKARSLITSINAIQDLHGLPFPYVGGAYKNKLPMTVENLKALNTTGTWSGNVYTVSGGTITIVTDDGGNVTGIKANGTFNADVYMLLASVSALNSILSGSYILNGCPSGGGESTYYIRIGSSGTDGGTGANVSTPFTGTNSYIFIKSGYTANNVLFLPMIRLATETDPTFAPYSNICPISGRDSVAVDDDGNLASPEFEQGGINGPIVPAVSYNSQKIAMSTRIRTKNLIYLPVDTEFTIDCDSSIYDFVAQSYDADGLCVVTAYPYNRWTSERNVYKSKGSFAIAIRHKDNSDISLSELSNVHLRICLTHTNVTIQLGTTVYGAEINWDTGVCTVTDALKVFTGGADENWYGNSSWNNHSFVLANALSDAVSVSGYTTVADIASNFGRAEAPADLVTTDLATVKRGVGQGDGRSLYVNIKDDLDTSTKFKNYLASNPLQVRYKLATPIELTLTPTEVQMLKGYNRVTIESGSIEVGYIAKLT